MNLRTGTGSDFKALEKF